MNLEWTDIVILVALAGYGLHRLKKTLLHPTASHRWKVAHVCVFMGIVCVGLLVDSTLWGMALGLAGAGGVTFVEEFVKARFGTGRSTGGVEDDG
jgi:hypothetical protein